MAAGRCLWEEKEEKEPPVPPKDPAVGLRGEAAEEAGDVGVGIFAAAVFNYIYNSLVVFLLLEVLL